MNRKQCVLNVSSYTRTCWEWHGHYWITVLAAHLLYFDGIATITLITQKMLITNRSD